MAKILKPPPPLSGFRFAAEAAGLRYQGREDLGLLVCDGSGSWAGVFTTSSVPGAPVRLARQRRDRQGPLRALLVNAGIANAGTGRQGLADARQTTAQVARHLKIPASQVLCASTGLIGERLPVERITQALPRLVAGLSPERAPDVARAMMTTDRIPKWAVARCRIDGRRITLVGLAKGAGMIAPRMATMLAFLLTDAQASPAFLRSTLEEVVDESFNALTVDGDMSTSDMAILWASGRAENRPLHRRHPEAGNFRDALRRLCLDLTRQLARDGEGASKLVVVRVTGAGSRKAAREAARRMANSNLVKTAVAGADPNWGRFLAALGAAGVRVSEERLTIRYGPHVLIRHGRYLGAEAERRAAAHLRRDRVTLTVDLGQGRHEFTYYTCDLTHDYITINAEYRT